MPKMSWPISYTIQNGARLLGHTGFTLDLSFNRNNVKILTENFDFGRIWNFLDPIFFPSTDLDSTKPAGSAIKLIYRHILMLCRDRRKLLPLEARIISTRGKKPTQRILTSNVHGRVTECLVRECLERECLVRECLVRECLITECLYNWMPI